MILNHKVKLLKKRKKEKPMKKMKRLLSLVLTLVMTVSIFTACGGNKENKEEEKAAITATAVKFSKDGKYTTTVSSKKVEIGRASCRERV